MTFRLGDVSRGMKMLSQTGDKALLSDCGTILEGLKQWPESAGCFERCGMWERAAEGWIKGWPVWESLLRVVMATNLYWNLSVQPRIG